MRTVYKLEDEQIDQLLATSAKSLADNFSNAKLAIEDNDYQKLGKVAHSLKGSLLNLGLNDFSNTAKKIEIMANEEEKTASKTLLSQLYEDLTGIL